MLDRAVPWPYPQPIVPDSIAAPDSPRGPLLVMRGIVKQFPGVRALDGVDLDVRAGEVHCLLGQNGAGKSTLIKVLSGVHRPDAGDIVWQGEHVTFANPQAAMKAGIATIYQELDLVDELTVAENIYIGQEPSRAGSWPSTTFSATDSPGTRSSSW